MSTERGLELARFVGSYHARRVADPDFVGWFDQLTPLQRRWLMDYQRVGVAMFDWSEFQEGKKLKAATLTGSFQDLMAAAQQFSEQVVAGLSKLGESLAPFVGNGISDETFAELMIAQRRYNLCEDLAKWLPTSAADTLAQYWPEPFMPDRLAVWAEDLRYDLGMRWLSLRCRVGWHSWYYFSEPHSSDPTCYRGCHNCEKVEDLNES